MVLDVFPFLDEFEILQLRLEELDPVVDQFVICQSAETFVGEPRRILDLQAFFPRYAHKIVNIEAPRFRHCQTSFERHYAQRDYCNRMIQAEDNDTVIYSDVDEIPWPWIIEAYRPAHGMMCISMRSFVFHLNCERPKPWFYPKMIPGHLLKRCAGYWLRGAMCDGEGNALPGAPFFADAGWHFSWIGTNAQLLSKAKASAHRFELEGSEIVAELEAGGSLMARDKRLGRKTVLAKVDSSFPSSVRNNEQALRSRGLII